MSSRIVRLYFNKFQRILAGICNYSGDFEDRVAVTGGYGITNVHAYKEYPLPSGILRKGNSSKDSYSDVLQKIEVRLVLVITA